MSRAHSNRLATDRLDTTRLPDWHTDRGANLRHNAETYARQVGAMACLAAEMERCAAELRTYGPTDRVVMLLRQLDVRGMQARAIVAEVMPTTKPTMAEKRIVAKVKAANRKAAA